MSIFLAHAARLLLAAGPMALPGVEPASAQMSGIFAGSTVGLPATGVPAPRVPPNPFASNYPSAPPPAPFIVERRDRRVQRGRPAHERGTRVRPAPVGALVPPGTQPAQGRLSR
jgi:hypothetical protein